MATAAVGQFSIEDDDRPKKPQQTAGGFTIGDIGPVTKGPDPAVMAASRARSAQPTQFEEQNAAKPHYGFGAGNLAKSFIGGIQDVGHAVSGLASDISDPNRPLMFGGTESGPRESTFHKNVIAPGERESEKAATAPNAIESIGHSIAAGIPLIGPWAAGAAEQAGTGDIGGAGARTAGQVAGGEVLHAGAKAVIPTIQSVGELAARGAGKVPTEGVRAAIADTAKQAVARATRTPDNAPRLPIKLASKIAMPHMLVGEGVGQGIIDSILPNRVELDTAGREYTPSNPTERVAEEARAQDVHDTNVANRKADMARATDIDATNKLNEDAQAAAAAKKAAADKQLIREGRAVPIKSNPNITPDKLSQYEAGRRGTTPEAEAASKALNDELERLARASEQEEAEARKPVPLSQSPNYEQHRIAQEAAAKAPVIPSIVTPQTAIEATQFSEGRPATWTNESLPSTIMNREAPMAAKRSAIQQLVLRNRPLPENARYLAGDANFGGVGSNPRSVTLFSPEGTPINSNPSPIIQPIAQRPGAGIPRITDMADDYIRSLGDTSHPDVEHGTELSGPNASGESAVSREALARQASERARGEQRIRIDTRSGKEIPLTSAEDVDARPGEHDVIVKRGPNGETVIDRGTKSNYRPGQKATPEASRVSRSVEEPNTYEIGDEEEPAEKKKKK